MDFWNILLSEMRRIFHISISIIITDHNTVKLIKKNQLFHLVLPAEWIVLYADFIGLSYFILDYTFMYFGGSTTFSGILYWFPCFASLLWSVKAILNYFLNVHPFP